MHDIYISRYLCGHLPQHLCQVYGVIVNGNVLRHYIDQTASEEILRGTREGGGGGAVKGLQGHISGHSHQAIVWKLERARQSQVNLKTYSLSANILWYSKILSY